MTQSQSSAATGCDTRDMRLVHIVFRAVFRDGPTLVDSVPGGDQQRARAVGDHLLGLAVALHNHHRTEDDLLWDTLTTRAPACAVHVGLMRAQHRQLAVVLAEAEQALPVWMASPTVENGSRVRSAMVEIDALLEEHLGDEERLILPVAGQTMSQREWDKLGEFARKETKPSMLFPQLGFMLDALPADEGRRFVEQTMPAPLRLLWRLVGQRQYRRYRRRVYGIG